MDSDTLIMEWLTGGVANAVASGILNPMDVSKTRLQLNIAPSKEGFFDIVRLLYKDGGLLGLLSQYTFLFLSIFCRYLDAW